MRKGIVITKADGAQHHLEVCGAVEASVDARIAEELARFPDHRAFAVLTEASPDWSTHWPTSPPPPPAPDAHGFEVALVKLLPAPAARNKLLTQYPLLLWSLRGGAYADVRALLDAALTTGALTRAQHDAALAAGRTSHLPGF